MTLLRILKYFLIHLLFTFVFVVCIVTAIFIVIAVSIYMDPGIAQMEINLEYYLEVILWYSFARILLFFVSLFWLYFLAFKFFKYLKYYWCILTLFVIALGVFISALPDFHRDYDKTFFYEADNRVDIPDEQNMHYYLFLLFYEDSLSQRHPDVYKLYNKQNENIDPQILQNIENIRLSNLYNREFVDEYSYPYYICKKINADFCEYIPEDIETRLQEPNIESIKKLNDFITYINHNTIGYQSLSREFYYWTWEFKNLFYKGLYYSLYEIEKWNIETWMEIYKQNYIFFHNFSQADTSHIVLMSSNYLDKFFTISEELINTYSIDLKYFDFHKNFHINPDEMMKNTVISQYLDTRDILDGTWVDWLENRLIDYQDLLKKYKWYLYWIYRGENSKYIYGMEPWNFYNTFIYAYMLKYNSLWYNIYFAAIVPFSWYKEGYQQLENKRNNFIKKYLNK